MQIDLKKFFDVNPVKGFLAHDEGMVLYKYALSLSHLGVCLEIGSYCGKSAIYLGEACKATQNLLFAVDHHRGSEEHQPGETYHDLELMDRQSGQFNSFPEFQRNIELAKLNDTVIPIVASSQLVVASWNMPLALVFVDGGHSEEQAMHDCLQWARHVVADGYMLIHDIYQSEAEGGQAPRLAMNALLQSNQWDYLEKINSLVVLRKRCAT